MKKHYGESLAWLAVLLVIFIGAWQLIAGFYQRQVLDQQQTYLEKKGSLLMHMAELNGGGDSLKDLSQHYVTSSDERITLLAADGAILFDTYDPSLEGTRSDRPEIKTLLQGGKLGVSLRQSDTLNKELLYVAIPVMTDGQLSNIIRIAEPTATFMAEAGSVRQSIFFVYSVLCLLITFLVLYFLRQKNRPIEKILPVLKKMATQPQKTELIMQTSPQWQELYQTINQLSEQLSQTYQAYTATENQLHTLLNELMIGVFILDEEQQLVMINPTMQEQLGITGMLSLPTEFASVIKDPGLIQLIYRINKHQPVLQEELRLKLPEEKVLDINLRLFNEQKQLMGISYDLTRVRQLEKMQKDFVSNVSHELKTPVTSLIGFTETLLAGAMHDPKITEEFLVIMQKDAQRLQRLIQDIIQLSKTEAELQYELQPIELPTLFQQLKDSYRQLLAEKQVTLTLTGSEPTYWLTNREFFYPIIKNLVENAIQYSPKNSQVKLSWRLTAADQLEVTVRDQGLGIDQDDQERIFERFYRVDKARARHSGGTGLGLAIVKDYTEKLGGTLHLTSHPQVGSTFSVAFPKLTK
ncbi:sensor histidine kinase [Enterococcus diestrammenae]|uniref:histidine kinase n=1 Tax=Enterococcus diestrammenae TaxID=1155073 RepID=A0ABV0F6C5_9ENTE|nr:ATP-binding protein [Enterococcus diestrammenae]KAF1297755.1 two-component sensor histidine kinase [Enterococcus diestrammenae]